MDRAAVTVGPGMDMPIMHDGDRYELVRDIGSGNFGVARLMRNRADGQLVAVKYIERGEKPLLLKSPVFFGGDEIRLSCPPKILSAMAAELDKKPAAMAAELDKIPTAMTAGRKRPQSETPPANKKGRAQEVEEEGHGMGMAGGEIS